MLQQVTRAHVLTPHYCRTAELTRGCEQVKNYCKHVSKSEKEMTSVKKSKARATKIL